MTSKNELEEIKKETVIERLRQAPPNIKVSFGMSSGKFLDRDELLDNVKKGTPLGQNIIRVQFAYLKAFKERKLMAE